MQPTEIPHSLSIQYRHRTSQYRRNYQYAARTYRSAFQPRRPSVNWCICICIYTTKFSGSYEVSYCKLRATYQQSQYSEEIVSNSKEISYVLLAVHPDMILVNNQLDAQFFMYVYFYSLHVSGSHVSIIRRIIVSMRHLV